MLTALVVLGIPALSCLILAGLSRLEDGLNRQEGMDY